MEQELTRYTCPCCGYKTISDDLEACEICGWYYDWRGQNKNPDEGGGPNPVTLRQAQQNFKRLGCCCELRRYRCRLPTADDQKDPDWHPLVD